MKRNTLLGLSFAAALVAGGAAVAQDRGGMGGTDPNRDPTRQNQQNQGRPGDTLGGQTSGKLDENQIRQVFQQKEYLKGLGITPRVEGESVVLEGNVPSKAHAIAAICALYELPNVKHVTCKLNFQGGAMLGMGGEPSSDLGRSSELGRSGELDADRDTGAVSGSIDTGDREVSGTIGGETSEDEGDAQLGSTGSTGDTTGSMGGRESTTLGAGMGQSQEIEVVVSIFPKDKATQSTVGGGFGDTTVKSGMSKNLTDVIIFRK